MLSSSCFFYHVAFCICKPTLSSKSRSSFELAKTALLNPADLETGSVAFLAGNFPADFPADLGGFCLARVGDPSSLAIFTNF